MPTQLPKLTKAQTFITELRSAGFRITAAREKLIELFCSASQPLTVSELRSQLKRRHLTPNKTTVYRELEFLTKRRLLSEIDLLDGKKRYELRDDGHHHHLLCDKCGKIQCVEMKNDLEHLENRLVREFNFEIKRHVLEFFGNCKECH